MPDGFLDDYLPYQLQRTDNLLSRRFHRSLRQRGIEMSEWRVLAMLLDAGPLQVSVLAERCLLPQPTTTHAVARLERAGHVTRTASAADGRHRIVTLTGAGRALAADLVDTAEGDLADTLRTAGVTVPTDFVARLAALRRTLEGIPDEG